MTVQESTKRPMWRPRSRKSKSSDLVGARAVVADANDPARRPDVLFRVRRAPDAEPSMWWNIGGFVVVSATVVWMLSFLN